jgi:peptidyl-prolyl cis-trans isomerase C
MIRWARVCALLCATACSDSDEGPAPVASGKLEHGIVARVGGEDIYGETVARIAKEQHLPLAEARARAIYDALFALGARGDLDAHTVEGASRTVLSRALLHEIWRETSAPPIGSEELDGAVAQRWTMYDRPPGFRPAYVVVRLPPNASADMRERARRIAEDVREAVADAAKLASSTKAPEMDELRMFNFHQRVPDPAAQAFIKAARGVKSEGLELLADELPPIATDHRVIEHGAPPDFRPVDPEFSAATVKLERRGDLSEVFASSHGFHVIMLLDVTPEKRVPRAEAQARLEEDILRARARRAKHALLERLRRERGVDVAPNAAALVWQVKFDDAAEPSRRDEGSELP